MRRLPGPQGLLVPTGLALLGLWLNAAVAFADGPGVPSVGAPSHVVSAVTQVSQAAKPAAASTTAAASGAASQAAKSAPSAVHAAANSATTTAATTAKQVMTQAASTTATPVHKASSAVSATTSASRPLGSEQPHKTSEPATPPTPVMQTADTAVSVAAPVVEEGEPVVSAVEPVIAPVEPIVEAAVEPLTETVQPVLEALAPLAEPIEPVLHTLEPAVGAVQQPPILDLQPIVEASVAAAPGHDSAVSTPSNATDLAEPTQPGDPDRGGDDTAVTDVRGATLVGDAPLGLASAPQTWIELPTSTTPSGDAASSPEAQTSSAPLRAASTSATQAASLPLADVAPGASKDAVAAAQFRPASNLGVLEPRVAAEFDELSQPFNPSATGQNRFGGSWLGAFGDDALSLAMPLALPGLGPLQAPSSSGSGPPPLREETPSGPPELPTSATGGALVSGTGGAGAAVLVAGSLVLAAAWRTLWQVARLRPVGITLPDLAPPG